MSKDKTKVTAGELVGMVPAIQDLVLARMPSGAAYKAKRLVQQLEKEINVVITQGNEVMASCGAIASDDGTLTVPASSPHAAKARKEMTELYSQEIEIDVDVLTIPSKVELQTATLLALDKFIKVA